MSSMKRILCFPTMVNWKLRQLPGSETHSAWWFFSFLPTTISNLYSLNDNSGDSLGTTYKKHRARNKELGNINGVFHHVPQLHVNDWKKKEECKKWVAKQMVSRRRFWMRLQEGGFFPRDETYLWRWGEEGCMCLEINFLHQRALNWQEGRPIFRTIKQ